jgi:hypothetical protein
MTISKFFNIYSPAGKRKGMVEFLVRVKSIFIYLCQNYSNNKDWRRQLSWVSGQWESVNTEVFSEDQRVPWEWAPLVNDLREPPELNITERRRVDTMLILSWMGSNFDSIKFDHIVTDTNMREILEYWIPGNKVPFDKKGKSKTAKKGQSETDALKRDAPKKGKGKKSNASDKGKKKVQDLADKGKGKMSKASVRVPAKDQEKTPQPNNKLMGVAIKIKGGDSWGNGQRVKMMAKKRPRTLEAGGGDEVAKRPKHADINQHLRGLVSESKAYYVHPRIHIPTPLVSFEEELSNREEAIPVDFNFVRISDGFKFEDLEADVLIRKARVSLSPSPLISNNFFLTSPPLGEEIFAAPLAPGVVLTEDTLKTSEASTRTLERLQTLATGEL